MSHFEDELVMSLVLVTSWKHACMDRFQLISWCHATPGGRAWRSIFCEQQTAYCHKEGRQERRGAAPMASSSNDARALTDKCMLRIIASFRPTARTQICISGFAWRPHSLHHCGAFIELQVSFHLLCSIPARYFQLCTRESNGSLEHARASFE